MKTAALFLTLAVASSPTLAADIPSLTGTWKGPSDGVMLKGGWLLGDVTIVISEQKGRSFRGEITYPVNGKNRSEPIVGTLDSDGDRIMFTGDNGHYIAEYDDGVIEDCFVSDSDNAMAVCMALKKQP